MQFSVSKRDDSAIVTVSGEVDLYSVSVLKEGIAKQVDDPACMRLEFDFENVTYLDSSGIGYLIVTQRKLKARGAALAIRNVKGEAARVFQLSGLSRFLTIID